MVDSDMAYEDVEVVMRMKPADSRALPKLNMALLKDCSSHADVMTEMCNQRENQLAQALKMNRLILRDSLTQKYGRNPTEEEMELNMRIWSDAVGVKG